MRHLSDFGAKMMVGVLCAVLVGVGFGAMYARAAAPNNYRWVEHDNGLSGTYVAGFAVDPTSTSTMYVLLVNKGVYKSTDGGVTWAAANGTSPNNYPYYKGIEWYGFGNMLTINPYNPQIVYANAGGQFYETTNGGGSWANINSGITICAPNYQGAKIVVDPTSSSTLFATHITSGCDGGLYESTTTSSTPSWTRIAGPGINSLPNDTWPLAIDPTNDQNMYVATVHNEILYSRDGGATWTQSSPTSTIVASGDYDGEAVAVSPTDTSTVFIGFISPSDRGLYVSHDAGATWTSLSNQVPGQVWGIQFASSTPLTGYAVGSAGVFKTTDGGATWHSTSFTRGGLTVTIDPKDANVVIVGTLGSGLYKTINGGATFAPLDGNLPLVAGNVSVSADKNLLIAASPGLGVFRSVDRGMSWQKTFSGFSFQAVSVAPGQQDVVYLSSLAPLGVYRSTDSGATWNAMTTTQMFYDLGVAPNNADKIIGVSSNQLNIIGLSLDGGATWVTSTPVSNMLTEGTSFDPFNPSIAYIYGYGGGSFYRSLDGGATWATSTTGCTDCATALDSLGVSPYTPGLLFASTRNNYVYKSTDHGATWTQVGFLPPAFPNQGWAWSFVFDPHSSSTVYVGDQQYSDAWHETTDGGATWNTLSVAGYPPSTLIHQLTMDPQDATRFISGSSQGVYIYENAIPVTASSTFSGSTGTVASQQSLSYAVRVVNNGYATSTQTYVRIALPSGMNFSGGATLDGAPITPMSAANNQVVFNVGDIAPLGNVSLTYSVSPQSCGASLSQFVVVTSVEDTRGTAISQPLTVIVPCQASLPPQAYAAPAPPVSGSFLLGINGGAAITAQPTVSLSLVGGSNVSAMALSNTPDFVGASEQPYSATTSWNLCAGLSSCDAGTHTVYVKLYTSWGVASPPISASITYAPAVFTSGTSSVPVINNALSSSQSLNRASLEEQLAALRAQLASLLSLTYQASTTPATPVVNRFTKDLSLGMTDAQVLLLQQVLNRSADTRVASSGAGSPGRETDYFGPATKRAVSAFQEKYRSIILIQGGYTHPTGRVGPATRAKLNALIGG